MASALPMTTSHSSGLLSNSTALSRHKRTFSTSGQVIVLCNGFWKRRSAAIRRSSALPSLLAGPLTPSSVILAQIPYLICGCVKGWDLSSSSRSPDHPNRSLRKPRRSFTLPDWAKLEVA